MDPGSGSAPDHGPLPVPLQRGGRAFVWVIVLKAHARTHTHTLSSPARAATPVFASMAHRYYPPSSGRDKWLLVGRRRRRTERAGNKRPEAQRGPPTEGGGAGGEQPASGEPGDQAKFAGKRKIRAANRTEPRQERREVAHRWRRARNRS